MFDYKHYVPVLKWKRGEQKALEFLAQPLKQNMTPLLEIPPISYDEDEDRPSKLGANLNGIGKEVAQAWNSPTPVFIDCIQLEIDEQLSMSNGQHFLEYIIHDIENNGTKAIPVANVAHYDPFFDALKNVNNHYGRGFCLRVKRSELNDLNTLTTHIDRLLPFMGLTPKDVDLVLDYDFLGGDTSSTAYSQSILNIIQFPHLTQWRTFSIIGTSMPAILRMRPNTTMDIDRIEWNVYEQIIKFKNGLGRVPTFGDYTINNPTYGDFDPSYMQVAATIRYTVRDKFLIFRGMTTRGPGGFQQYISLARDVISHPDYSGAGYSYGDQYIFDCAHQQNGVGTGSHETWRRATVNHHLTLVINELANLHGSSTPGTPVASIRP
ncbi:beta family protein [Brevibacillus massiliensis]|uniref:beta family protein n=1 Tax=Brevibacillus massiliensis TaxID=1118054 RepID=UPI00031EDF22|nr:beta family protein [Brevibacillus massiliensis]